MDPRLSRLQIAGAVAVVLVSAAALFFAIAFSEKAPFLLQRAPAEWIAFPSRPLTYVPPVELANPPTATFGREFPMQTAPEAATLSIRALGAPEATVNGQTVRFERSCLKRVCRAEVSQWLRAGRNRLLVRVSHTKGPPLLWAHLEAPGLELATDERWSVSRDGGAAVPAVVADDTRPLPNATTNAAPLAALREHAVAVAALFLVSAGAFLASRGRVSPAARERLPALACGAVCALWVWLFVAKITQIPLVYGSDARDHVFYVKTIAEQGRLPLANEGFVTYNPPAFYALAAGVSAIVGPEEGSAAEAWALKLIPFLSGLGMVWITFALARRLFPDEIRLQVFAVLAAGLLPLNVSLSSYVSNEPFHAFLASLALLLAVRAMHAESPRWSALAPLALVLGLAALTRYTALMIAPVIAGFVGFKLYAADRAPLHRALLVTGAVLAGVAAIAGWVYVRNWIHFGDPLVWNFDTYEGFTYWEHPGFHTATYFLRFGEVLVQPYYSSFLSFWDGIYSTIWGEGLPPGGHTFRKPHELWSYDFMSIGFLAALPAALLAIPGFAIAFGRSLSGDDAARRVSLFLVLTLLYVFAFTLLYVNVHYAFWESTKTKYALGAVAPFALVIGVGLDACDRWLARRAGDPARAVFYGWLGVFVGVLALSFAA